MSSTNNTRVTNEVNMAAASEMSAAAMKGAALAGSAPVAELVAAALAKASAQGEMEARRTAAAELAGMPKKHGITAMAPVLAALTAALADAQNAGAREGALLAIEALLTSPECRTWEPFVVQRLATILVAMGDPKSEPVRKAAEAAMTAFTKLVNPHATALIIPILLEATGPTKKWQTRVAALELLGNRARNEPKAVAESLMEVLPAVADCVNDTRAEVVAAAEVCLADCVQVVGNPDLVPFIPALLSCIARPGETSETVHKLASTTFVTRVEKPTLALMVPVLERGLRERAVAIKRKCCLIVENMTKLVTDPAHAQPFLPQLLPGLERAKDEVSDPECRAVAARAHAVLLKAAGQMQAADGGAGTTAGSPKAGEPSSPSMAKKSSSAKLTIKKGDKGAASPGPASPAATPAEVFGTPLPRGAPAALVALKDVWKECSHTVPAKQASAEADLLAVVLAYVACLGAALLEAQSYDRDEWADAVVLPYLDPFMPEAATHTAVATAFLKRCYADTHSGEALAEEAADEGEDVCNCEFSLAYGARILLNTARLHLKRGHRYGLCGANGCGKTTLLRAIANGQVDGFPPASEVRTVYVEHDIQASVAEYSVVDYIYADGNPVLAAVPRDETVAALTAVGFTAEMQASPITALSGGWKMKLALVRAMLMRADILLLDEPTNHLDVTNVGWLVNYLNTQCANVTAMMVSHDSGFLDKTCTDILHYEGFKLHRYRGNLSQFVKVKPEAMSYYELAATNFSFKLPEPGYLEGVKDRAKAVLKMTRASFAYPGTDRKIFTEVSLVCSLASRVACVGPNGAGKSTLVRALIGELVPQEGIIVKHPMLRVAFVAQHAFAHLSHHLDKTPSEYIQWRFASGEDKEALVKESTKISEEEEKKMAAAVVLDGAKFVVERLLGRRKLRSSYEYEAQFVGQPLDKNRWLPRSWLEEHGFGKLVDQLDAREAAAAGLHSKLLTAASISQHLADVGLDSEIALHSRIRGLSGGQKVKLVIGAACWMNPHIIILDEPSNYLDRDSLGALAGAINEYGGGVIMISHNKEFTSALCKETWHVGGGTVTTEGESWAMPLALKGGAGAAGGDELTDAAGNVIKVKEKKKKMSNAERRRYLKERQARIDRGEDVSDTDEDM